MPSKPSSAAAVSSEAARVWMTTGLPSSAASSSCALEELALAVARRVVAVVVEPGLPDRDGALGCGEQLAQLVDGGRVGSPAWCGWIPSAAKTPVVSLGDGERLAAGVEPGADRDDPLDPGLARARHEHVCRLRARVEVRVRVDHAAAVGWSTRGKSGAAGAMPSVGGVSPYATRPSASSTGCPSAPRISGAVSGRYGDERDRDRAHPVREVVEHRGRARRPAPRPSRAATAPSPRRGGSASGRPPRCPRARRSGRRRRSASTSFAAQRVERVGELLVRPRRRDPSVAVAGDHRRRPRDQVAEVVRELALVALVQAVERRVAVLAERDRRAAPRSAPRRRRRRRRGRAGRSRYRATSRSSGRRAAASRARTAASATS